MEEIKKLSNKCARTDSQTDSALPYKYIPDTIRELSEDIKKIVEIINGQSDPSVLKECEFLKSKLDSSLNFFETKMKGIPNWNYMDESDEEWVDKNMPVKPPPVTWNYQSTGFRPHICAKRMLKEIFFQFQNNH